MNRRALGAVVGVLVIAAAVVLYLVLGRAAGGNHSGARGSGAGSQGATDTSTAAQQRTGSIRGRVTDAKGPLAGAMVCASTRDEVQTCASTDAQGAYAIENLVGAAYRITALAPQHRPATYGVGEATGSWLVLASGTTRDKIDFVLRAGMLLSGTVQDINGGPIAGAKVRVQTQGGFDTLGETRRFWSPPVASGKDGAFQIWVAPGRTAVAAVAEGYGESSVDAEAPTSVVILLTPEGSVAGTVVDANDHPVADAVVVARSLGMVAETVTDENGAFTIDHLEAAPFKVSAHTANAFGNAPGEVAVSLGKQTTVKIQLLAAARISGVVMVGDKPCPEPRVDLRDPRTEMERSMIDDGHDGAVHIDGLLPGEYVLHPKCPGGYEPIGHYARLVVTETDQSGLVWHTMPGATLRGRVTNQSGAPVADVLVEAKGSWPESDRTKDDGTYEITGLRALDYTVSTVKASRPHAPVAEEKGVEPGATVTLTIAASTSIAGTVVYQDGKHPREFVVSLRDDAKTFFRDEEFLGTNGVFHLDDLVAGPSKLTVTDPDRGFIAAKISLAPGEAKKGLVLVLKPMVEIHGRLVDAKTKQPIEGQIVLAESTESVVHPSSFYDDFNHTTAADGTFRFMAPVGDITVKSFRVELEARQRCEGKAEETIDGPTDVGDIELTCKKL